MKSLPAVEGAKERRLEVVAEVVAQVQAAAQALQALLLLPDLLLQNLGLLLVGLYSLAVEGLAAPTVVHPGKSIEGTLESYRLLRSPWGVGVVEQRLLVVLA